MTGGYPSSQRANLFSGLLDDLNRYAETEGVSHNAAFMQQGLDWLGIDTGDQTYRVDGGGDRGLDCYRFGSDCLEIIQFKSQDFMAKSSTVDQPAGPQFLTDIGRIISFLTSAGDAHRQANRLAKRFLKQLQSVMRTFQQVELDDQIETDVKQRTYTVTITLAILARGLTPQAQEEFATLVRQNQLLKICGVDVLCDIKLQHIEDFIATRWQRHNLTWRDAAGQNDDSIVLHVEGNVIDDRTSLIFYSRAVDLVQAYNRFGYQVFEPNVRCEIRNSSVNREIAKQIDTERGIYEFKYLNNGVTIVCENRNRRDTSITVKKPGIVNGLQTVTTLSSAYEDLAPKLKKVFDDDCHVLVRLYLKQKIQVPRLVKATNNQNPMEPRNLRSNEDEQIVFERLFANLNWFYERKQFAWEAFSNDEASWPTLRNRKRSHFQVKVGVGRPTIRKVDNQDLMQSWLSFCGFVNESVQRRRDFFSSDRFYDRVFKTRMTKHAFDYEFQWSNSKIDEDAASEAPTEHVLLLSHLTNSIANELIPTSRAHREQCIHRLGLQGKTREEQDVALNEDSTWLAGLIRAAAPMLYTELCGFVFFRGMGSELYNASPKLLRKTDMGAVFERLDVSGIRSRVTDSTPVPDKHELFSQLWLLFNDLVERLAEDHAWRSSFFQQSSRPRFMYSVETRKRLLKMVEQLDKTCATRRLNMVWSEHFDGAKGIFKAVSTITRNLR